MPMHVLGSPWKNPTVRSTWASDDDMALTPGRRSAAGRPGPCGKTTAASARGPPGDDRRQMLARPAGLNSEEGYAVSDVAGAELNPPLQTFRTAAATTGVRT